MAGMDSSSSAISNVWPGATGSLDGLYGTVSTDAGVMALDGGSGSAGGNSITAGTLAEAPFFRSWPDSVFDNDTQTDRRTVSYHITTLSNKPLDLSILLLDALDQVASGAPRPQPPNLAACVSLAAAIACTVNLFAAMP